MTAIERSISRARQRIIVQRGIAALGWLMLGAVVSSIVLLLVDRALAVPVSVWVYAVAAGALVLAAPVLALIGRPTPQAVAAAIDTRLQLKDRIGTALFAQSMRDDPFAQYVMHDAEETAGHARVAAAFPLHLTRVWGWVPPALGVLALLAVFLQPMDLFGLEVARQDKKLQEERAEADRDQLKNAIKAIKLTEPKEGQQPESAVQLMQELADLTNRDLSNPQMRREAAAKVAQVKEKLAAATAQKKEEFQSLQNALSQTDTEQEGPADKFADALRRGDFEAAKQALNELGKTFDKMSDADKKALGQQLDNMAKQLDQAAQQFAQQQAQQQQQMQQALQNAGLTPQQAQQLAQQAQNMTQQQLQQQLQQQGMSQQQAQQMAQQMKQMAQQQQKAGQCKQCAGGMAGAMKKMGKACKNGQGGQSFQQGMGQCQGGMSQMAQMQQQLQQMQMAQGAMQQALNQLGQPNQGGNWQQSQSTKPNNGVGPGIGNGPGGNPFGPERQHKGYTANAEGDIGQGEGRVIASWLNKGDNVKGQPQVAFDQAVTEARAEAEKAVTDDHVPKRYHPTIRHYFDQLPRTPQQVQPAPAPADGSK